MNGDAESEACCKICEQGYTEYMPIAQWYRYRWDGYGAEHL